MTDNTVRYGICDREDDPFMERCEDGDWVNFSDYTALAAERDTLRAENDLLKAQIYRLTAAGDNLTAWVDDRGTPDVRKWDKARDEAFRAIAEAEG